MKKKVKSYKGILAVIRKVKQVLYGALNLEIMSPM